MVAHAQDLVRKHGFTTHKLKGGVFPPQHDLAVLFAEIDAQGGVVPAIESGWFQRQIAHSSMRFQAELDHLWISPDVSVTLTSDLRI